MIQFIKKIAIAAIAVLSMGTVAQAQEFAGEYAQDGYNHYSLYPIHDSHIMYRKTLWFRVMLREKQNMPFRAKNMEITKLIIDAAKMGILRPYMNDSLRTRMTTEQFLENLKIPSEEAGLSEEELALGFSEEEEDWGSDGGWGGDSGGSTADVSNEFFPSQLDILNIREDLVFDKKHSRMKHDIQAITIIIPSSQLPTGIEKELATFSYKELVENLFRDNPDAVWYNEHNTRTHVNLEHAFDLRLFSGRIVKYSNGQDNYIVDIYGEGKDGLVETGRYAHWLVEYETNLWEN